MRRETPEWRLCHSLTLFIMEGQYNGVRSLNKTFGGGEDRSLNNLQLLFLAELSNENIEGKLGIQFPGLNSEVSL
jgi:hypothetical protein